MLFNQQSGVSSPMDILPAGFLCWVQVTFRGMKTSQETGGSYADLEFTVGDNQPNARKKLWDIVADPDDTRNSEKWREMAMVSITRMLEAAQLVDPTNAASYDAVNGKTCQQIMALLDGRYVAIRVKVEEGKNGYADKNKVGDYLTPNAQSQTNKNFLKLLNKDHGIAVNPAAVNRTQSNFGTPPAAQHAGASFGNAGNIGNSQQQQPQQTQPPAPASPGFNPNQAPAFLRSGQVPF